MEDYLSRKTRNFNETVIKKIKLLENKNFLIKKVCERPLMQESFQLTVISNEPTNFLKAVDRGLKKRLGEYTDAKIRKSFL